MKCAFCGKLVYDLKKHLKENKRCSIYYTRQKQGAQLQAMLDEEESRFVNDMNYDMLDRQRQEVKSAKNG